MYGAIPDVVISKPPRKNQFRVVVALGVGVMIGALGTAMLFPVATKDTDAPTAAPRPVLAAEIALNVCQEELDQMASDVGECYNKLYGKEGKTSRAAMELDAQSDRCNEDVDEKTETVVSCCLKVDEALARCARLPCFPGTCNLNRDIC